MQGEKKDYTLHLTDKGLGSTGGGKHGTQSPEERMNPPNEDVDEGKGENLLVKGQTTE